MGLQKAKRRSQFSEHLRVVICIAISPDGNTIASCDMNDRLLIWRSDSSEIVAEHQLDGISTLRFSPNGVRLAVASDDGVCLFRTSNGRLIDELPASQDLVFAPSGGWLAQFSSPEEVNESLFSDDSINAVQKKVALEILQARRGVRGDPETNQAP